MLLPRLLSIMLTQSNNGQKTVVLIVARSNRLFVPVSREKLPPK
jgi:hypothetical protein